MREIVTKSPRETKEVAARLAREISTAKTEKNKALVIALEGDLGSGKTTFAQGFAKALGIKENIVSPTFVLMKIYEVQRGKFSWKIRHLIHIDCYRLDSPKDLLHLGFRELLKDQDAVIIIEWAERIKNILPKNVVKIQFHHISPNQRGLSVLRLIRNQSE